VLRRETSWARRKKEKGKMSPSASQLRIAAASMTNDKSKMKDGK
jgi:hypothetical protein